MSNAQKLLPTLAANPRLDQWVTVNADGTVTVRTGKVEIGQGIVSAMAQLAAEELDVAYARIRMVPVDTAASPNEGSTTGSRSVEEGGGALRQACAEARDLLLQAAARKLEATLERLEVEDGTIRVRGGGASVTYWQLAPEVDFAREATGQVRPKAREDLRLVGERLPRLDIPAKVSGAAFLQDLDLPGMLHGRVVRPPAYRARLVSLDDARARAIAGVRAVVREGSFLGVVAEREEQAIRAREALLHGARWSEPNDLPDEQAIPAFLLAQPVEDEVLVEKGAARAASGAALEATYTRPYLAHASLAPSCAIACWRDGRLEIWAHSQSIYALRDELAKTLELPPERVIARHAEGAGCYGHNGADDVALDAALLARAVDGRPVRVQWMRDDEFAWEPYGPAMVVKLRGALDGNGGVAEWREEIWGPRHITRPGRHPAPGLLAAWHLDRGFEPPPAVDMPIAMGGGSQRNAVPYYDFPNEQVVNHVVKAMPLRISTLRGLGAHLNVFAIESFMDELAHAAGADPLEFRLRHLKDERARAVIRAAAKAAGWAPGAKGDGVRGRGIGFARYKNLGDWVAVVAEVVVEESIRVPRIVTAIDCGRVVNPDGVANQAEGGIIQAMSWTLKEQVRFDRARVTTRNWEDYPILTFDEAPSIEVVLVDRPDEPSIGVGEGMMGPAAAAIGNAVFNAMGVRVRDLPLTAERVAAAIHAADA
ncbi:MAG: xanthine dehydrogenase family protein molybdopterin-binding subunit [Betaproteobacteria bacterium]|nr:xanthine dehydrogenase family protein molybdopterin-binding subunit [Betaproteobacteria bacterium]